MNCIPQASLSTEFSSQEFWSGWLFPSPGNLPNPGVETGSTALQVDSIPSEPLGKPMYRCESWTHKETWVLKNWCFQAVVLETTLESPLDGKAIRAINLKGNQPWIFIRRTDAEAEAPILWSPVAKSLLTGRNPDTGKDWGQEEKRATED